MLNEQQRAAAEDTEGAILVLAGAGSGKTRVLTARICNLLAKGVDAYNVLAITFTNKAAAEMKERIERACGFGGVWTSTFHSMCARILRRHAELLGYDKNFSIYTDLESDRVVKRVAEQVEGANPKLRSQYLWHISRAKTFALNAEEYYNTIRQSVDDARVICGIYLKYEEELKRSNAMDFDDLLLKTKQLFDGFPDVLDSYARRFRYIHVDEFQDTNGLQFTLVKQLASVWGNIFAVGDEDQSIYSWRGAEIKNILDFKKTYPDARIYKLEQNYRSTTSILDAANKVIRHNSERNEKTLWSEFSDENSVKHFDAASDREEAGFVAREINARVNNGTNYRDIAVLVRANALTRLFEEEFNLHGIPYKIFGGFRFFERKEIKDVLGYVRLALNPNDNDSVLRVINYPKRGIGATAVNALQDAAARYGMTYFSVLRNAGMLPDALYKKLSAFRAVVEQLIEASIVLSPSDFIRKVIELSGIEQALSSGSDPDDANRLENVMELVNAVAQFEKDNQGADISDFMQSVSLVSDADGMDDENYVSLATVHAVKGLEFDTVFIVGLEDGIFPTSRALSGGDIEEERRLMYVAITRAKRRLYTSCARSRYRFGETVYFPRSRFIAEMRGEKQSLKVGNAFFAGNNPERRRDFESAARAFSKENLLKDAKRQTAAPSVGRDFSEFAKDVMVEHVKFGRGLIISTEGTGDGKVAAIAFKGLGVKRFSLSIAAQSLKIVKE